jgi:hypothetical protein
MIGGSQMNEVDLLDLDTTDQLFSDFTGRSRQEAPGSSLKKVWPHDPSSVLTVKKV